MTTAVDKVEEDVERDIADALDFLADGQVTILIGTALSPALIKRVLDNRGVFGIIRGETSVDDPWGGALFVDRNGGREIVPLPIPRVLFMVLRERLGVRAGVALMRRGVRRVFVLTPWKRAHRRQWLLNHLLTHLLKDSVVAMRHHILPDEVIRTVGVVRRLAETLNGRWAPNLSRVPRQEAEASLETGPIVLASGSLGAGGSERQLVLAAVGIKKRVKNEVQILCQSKLADGGEFFLKRIDGHGVAVRGDIKINVYNLLQIGAHGGVSCD